MYDFNAPIVRAIVLVTVLVSFGLIALLCLWHVEKSILDARDLNH